MAEAKVVRGVVGDIYSADPTILSAPQKAIAVKVVAHSWRSPMDESLEKISAGFRVFERVSSAAELNRGTVAQIGEKAIAFYESGGADDIKVDRVTQRDAHESTISLVISEGMAIEVEPFSNNSFPDPKITQKSYRGSILSTGYGDSVAEQMGEFDPDSPKFKSSLIRLGSAEKPKTDLNPHLTTDAERFAGRLLAITMGKHDWIQITAPGDKLRNSFVDSLSSVYKALLTGNIPSDLVVRTRSVSRGMGMGSRVVNSRARNTPLSTYDRISRGRLLYAADVSASDIELATREKIKKLEHSLSL